MRANNASILSFTGPCAKNIACLAKQAPFFHRVHTDLDV